MSIFFISLIPAEFLNWVFICISGTINAGLPLITNIARVLHTVILVWVINDLASLRSPYLHITDSFENISVSSEPS